VISVDQLKQIEVPVLAVQGSLDGVNPMTSFAVTRYKNSKFKSIRYAVMRGASHSSLMNQEFASLHRDLPAMISSSSAIKQFASIIYDFVGLSSNGLLNDAERIATEMADPIVKALQLEGSEALGNPWCNSDFPTNPTCQYPIYPGKSLPPGPAPPPNPLPSDTCVCGSEWVRTTGSDLSADLESSSRPTAIVLSNDAFHDVSDTHPFHLPNIFNECSAEDLSSPCTLNTTTVTMPIIKAGDLFDPEALVYSAFELRTKFKSRQAIWSNAGLGKGTDELDKNTNACKEINQAAYDWALANAEPSVREIFDAYGEPYVMVDDVEAPIGDHGPTWIEEELIYTRVQGGDGKYRIEVQSWSFVVANLHDGETPWWIPVGMHYCKLLSPARAMEWIYTEGVRAGLAALSSS
jgi:hypothetical protein